MNPKQMELLALAAENNNPSMLDDIPDKTITDWFASSMSDYRIVYSVLTEMFGFHLLTKDEVPENCFSVLDYLEYIGIKDAVLNMFHGQDYVFEGKQMNGKYQLRRAMLITYNEIFSRD